MTVKELKEELEALPPVMDDAKVFVEADNFNERESVRGVFVKNCGEMYIESSQ